MPNEKTQLSTRKKAIVRALQGDIPICAEPFAAVARQIGIPEQDLIDAVRDMKARGILRRFGATLRHQRVGYTANAMSAWIVPEEEVEQLGNLLASLPEVTHCYERPPQKDWPFNLYAMIHGKNEAECAAIARDIAARTGIREFVLLFSSQENKKESMQYF
jgi:DNA-binding Lrp family transcriptional regulator